MIRVLTFHDGNQWKYIKKIEIIYSANQRDTSVSFSEAWKANDRCDFVTSSINEQCIKRQNAEIFKLLFYDYKVLYLFFSTI